jgi:hypothetical protein
MTQTAVNFTIDTWNSAGQIVGQSYDTRIFDFEQTQAEVNYYGDCIQQLENVFSSGNFTDTSELQTFKDNLYALEAWSQLKDASDYDPETQTVVPQYNVTTSGSTTPNAFNPGTALAALGYLPQTTSISANLTDAMSQDMATQLVNLNNLLSSVGYNTQDPTASNASLSQLGAALSTLQSFTTQITVQNPTNPAVTTQQTVSQFTVALQNAMNSLATATITDDAESGASSLQEVLQTDYIALGNELIYNEMSQLQEAMNANQTALSYLNSVQDLMNQKSPQQFTLDLAQLSTTNPQTLVGQTSTGSAYDTFESGNFQPDINGQAYFANNPALAQYCETSPGSGVYKTNLFVQAFNEQLSGGSQSAYTFSLQQIYNNLGALVTSLEAATAGNTSASSDIISSIQAVQNDMLQASGNTLVTPTSTNPNPPPSGESTTDVTTWVDDMTTNSTYQNDLSNAITAAQGFNDTENENLQNVMFVFEEFYKSATSMTSDLTQLIEQIASYISK